MKHFFTHTLLALLVLACATNEASAQQFNKRKQYNSVGVSLNAMNYFGDVVPKASIPSFRFAATRPNVGLTFTRRFTPRVSGRANLAYGRITGDDTKAADPNDRDAKYRYNRNFAFRNDLVELSAVGVFDLIENRNTYVRRPDFVPYVFAGIAAFYHNPKGLVRDNAIGGLTPGDYVELQPLKTEGQANGYSKTQISIPFGGGIRYKINKDFDIGLEIGWRKTFTDYLDDISGNFADPADLAGSTAAQYFGRDITRSRTGEFAGFDNPGTMRGKSNEDDWYIVTGITLNYILQPRVKSPKFR